MGKAKELLPEYDHVVFNNHFLELCLVQVKYPSLPRFSEETYMVGIKEALMEEYPLATVEQGMNIIITPQGANQTLGASFLRFTSIDGHWSVILSSEFVSLEARRYTNFAEFSTRFAKILRDIALYLHPRYQLRLGLRYINEFRHPHGDCYDAWQKLLNAEILGGSANKVIDGNVEQTLGEVLTHRDDGHVLIRHGFLKGTTVTPLAGHMPKTGPFYLLDLDYYDDTVVTFNTEKPIEKIKRFNDFLYRIFRWAIGDSELHQLVRG